MSQTHNTEDFAKLVELIRLHTGLTVGDTKSEDVAQAIKKLLVAHRLSGVSGLLIALNHAPTTHPLWQELIDTVTVGETYFFRNEPQFQALRAEIFPALIAKRRESGSKFLRLWCAGCATGEEPYSLAMLLRDLLPDYQSWQITLIATDINSASMEHAKRGIYRSWSFRNETPDDVKQRWFVAKNDAFKLDDTIKHMVSFRSLNLVTDVFPSFESGLAHIDLIMCRNVTIYFDQETTRRVVGQFYDTLNTDGWLVVGHSEPMSSIYTNFKPRNFTNTIIYHKSASDAAQTQAAAGTEPVQPAAPPLLKFPVEKIAAKPPRRIIAEQWIPEPTTAKTTWQQAKTAADLEQWQDALVLLAKAETENKFQPQVFYLRAIVQIHLDDLTGAHTSLRQALYCDPQFALAHYTLGELYDAAGDTRSAVQHWKSAQSAIEKLNPESHLPFGEDLTVEMLQGLLTHSLQRISLRAKGAN